MAENNVTPTTVNGLLEEISTGLSQVSSSRKDEIRVMQAMLSDPSYEVSIYGKDGIEGTYNPTKDFRDMGARIITSAANVPFTEAAMLMEDYSVSKAEATSMINLSKEFVNTFLKTGRKLPLGAREKSDVSLSLKKVDASTRLYPQKVGVNEDGTDRYSKTPTTIPAHESVRVHAPCPTWVKG